MKLFNKEPDGRYVIWTLLTTILVPLPFLILIYAFLRQEFRVDFFAAFLGIFLFWILWLPSIWKGTYYERISPAGLDRLYQIAANALLFLYTTAAIFIFQDLVISKIKIGNLVLYAISLLFSYSSWLLGNKIKNVFSPPRDRWTNKLKVDEHSPYAYVLRAFSGFIALVIVLVILGLILTLLRLY